MDEAFDFQPALLFDPADFRKREFSGRHDAHRAERSINLRHAGAGYRSLCADVQRKKRVIPFKQAHQSRILHDYAVESRFVKRIEQRMHFFFEFVLLQQCIQRQVQLLSVQMRIMNRRHVIFRPGVFGKGARGKARKTHIDSISAGCYAGFHDLIRTGRR